MTSQTSTPCSECGSLLSDERKTCSNCGAPCSKPTITELALNRTATQTRQTIVPFDHPAQIKRGEKLQVVILPLLGALVGVGFVLCTGTSRSKKDEPYAAATGTAHYASPTSTQEMAVATSLYWKSLCNTIPAVKEAEKRGEVRVTALSKELFGLAHLPEEYTQTQKELAGFAQQVRSIDTTNVDGDAISYAMELSRFFDAKAQLWGIASDLSARLLDMYSGLKGFIRGLRFPLIMFDMIEGKIPPELKSDYELGNAEFYRLQKEGSHLEARKVELQASLVKKYNIEVSPWP